MGNAQDQFAFPSARTIALVADTHGKLADVVSGRLQAADLIIHAGDVGNAAVLQALAVDAPVLAVTGNNDVPEKWPQTDADVLADLPEIIEIMLAGGALVVVHGHQWLRAADRHDRLRKRWPHARCIVYGHSHCRVVDQDAVPWVLNPGAAGRARTLGGAGWLGLSISIDGWRVSRNGFC